jgi:hypothetical protein
MVDAMRDIQRGAMVPPQRPPVDEQIRNERAAQSPPTPQAAPLDPADPVDYLRLYPQQINTEYLTGMTAAIETFLADRDVDALTTYGRNINTEYAAELTRRAAAVIHGAQPVLTTLTGAATVDGSPADGATVNTATFTALDQYGSPFVATLNITGTGCTVDNGTIPTDSATGTAAVNATSDTAGAATITAASAGYTADVALTFAEVPPPPEE